MDGERRLTKNIPSLAEWLGDGNRAEGFEAWVSQTLGQEPGVTEREARFLRIAQTFAVACVETMRRETGEVPDPKLIGLAMAQWARASGYVAMCAAGSVLVPEAPFRRLARIWAEEFKVGAKCAADALATEQERAADGQ